MWVTWSTLLHIDYTVDRIKTSYSFNSRLHHQYTDLIRIITVEVSTLISERTDQETITNTKNEYWLSAIDFLKSQTRSLIRDYSDWLFKALKFSWYYSRTLAACSKVSVLTLPARVLHYDGTIEALVRILIDFLKVLRFHQNQSILAAPQPESSRVRHLESFYSAYDPCKPLNPCKTAPQPEHSAYDSCKPLHSCNMTSAFVPADQFIQKKLTKLKENNYRDEFIRRKMTKLDCFMT